jgi:methyl-accepting chemotaxis protein
MRRIKIKKYVEQSVETFEQLSRSINGIAEGTNHQAEDARESSVVMTNLSDSMQDVMHKTNTIFENIELSGLTKSIEDIMKLVDGISGQTNLLALNASIEAKTKDTVNLVEKSSEAFASQEEAVKQVYEIFYSLIDILKYMDLDLEQVNDKVKSMRTLKEEMVNKIDNIAIVTQESAASTQEVSALSEEQKTVIGNLYDLSNRLTFAMENLNATIQTFRVD